MLIEQIAQLYYTENQLVRALPLMAQAAVDTRLKQAFHAHHEETVGQVTQLDEAFRQLNERVQVYPCMAIDGLLAEGTRVMATHKGDPLLDQALIAAAQKIELHEVACYRSLCNIAEKLGLPTIVRIADDILAQERDADAKLTDLVREVGKPIPPPWKQAWERQTQANH